MTNDRRMTLAQLIFGPIDLMAYNGISSHGVILHNIWPPMAYGYVR